VTLRLGALMGGCCLHGFRFSTPASSLSKRLLRLRSRACTRCSLGVCTLALAQRLFGACIRIDSLPSGFIREPIGLSACCGFFSCTSFGRRTRFGCCTRLLLSFDTRLGEGTRLRFGICSCLCLSVRFTLRTFACLCGGFCASLGFGALLRCGFCCAFRLVAAGSLLLQLGFGALACARGIERLSFDRRSRSGGLDCACFRARLSLCNRLRVFVGFRVCCSLPREFGFHLGACELRIERFLLACRTRARRFHCARLSCGT
jgi:hypothetical protein